MVLNIPDEVGAVMDRLERAGFEAYVVGGCVRDSLMGAAPHDWDVATSARPEQTMRALAGLRLVETGLRHGTVTALPGGRPVEVTTFRVDGAYSDHRHPDEVFFTPRLEDDLARRDFTVNALAYSPRRGLVDRWGGEADLRARVIRAVGAPDARFREDALRILRGLRFASVLGFSLEAATARAILADRALLGGIAAERVAAELLRLLCGKNVLAVLLGFAPVFVQVLPELGPSVGFDQRNPYHRYDVYGHIAHSVAAAPPDPALRLAMLLHDVGKPACCTEDAEGVRHFYGHPKASAALAAGALARLKLDNATRRLVSLLVEHHDSEIQPDERTMRRVLSRFGEDFTRRLVAVKRADNAAQSELADWQDKIDACERTLERILEQGQCVSLRNLAVKGGDLIAAGVPAGPEVGRRLHALLGLVVDGDCPNDRAALLARLGGGPGPAGGVERG